MITKLDSQTVFDVLRSAVIKSVVWHKEQAFQLNRILAEDERINLMGPTVTESTRRSAQENADEANRLQFILDSKCLDLMQQEFENFVFQKKV